MSNYQAIKTKTLFKHVLAAVQATGYAYECNQAQPLTLVGYRGRNAGEAHLVVRQATLDHPWEDVGWSCEKDGTATLHVSTHRDMGKLPAFLAQVETLLATKVKQEAVNADIRRMWEGRGYRFEEIAQPNGHIRLVASKWQ